MLEWKEDSPATEEYVSWTEREQASAVENPTHGFKTLEECEAHAVATGNTIYAGLGKPCPKCHRFFSCSIDFEAHFKVCEVGSWMKSQFGGEYCLSETDPQLKTACRQNGIVHLGNYDYSLSVDGRYLKRKLAPK